MCCDDAGKVTVYGLYRKKNFKKSILGAVPFFGSNLILGFFFVWKVSHSSGNCLWGPTYPCSCGEGDDGWLWRGGMVVQVETHTHS